jgi:hypothetical protein
MVRNGSYEYRTRKRNAQGRQYRRPAPARFVRGRTRLPFGANLFGAALLLNV